VIEREGILGIAVSAIRLDQAVVAIGAWISSREQHYVTVTPAHAVMDAYRDPALRKIFNASGLTTPDGMAIVWLLRLHGHRQVERVYGPDLLMAVCRYGLAKGYRHFLYGGEQGVADALGRHLVDRLPELQLVGTWTPPFGPLSEQEDRAELERINTASPDIVWVGLGTPKQERWMATHLGRVAAPVMIGVGAAFDFLSGRKRQAPRWMQRSGLEWLFRLATEPRRLWPRYRRYPQFVVLAAAELLKLRRFPVDPG
jgi:N-acetylglucosaminyldiphosphoundecaprenol N-acetyl-beta-D-mannosaminyltransferase